MNNVEILGGLSPPALKLRGAGAPPAPLVPTPLWCNTVCGEAVLLCEGVERKDGKIS